MRKTAGKVKINCGACGIGFFRKPSSIRSAVVYCSHKCRASIQFSNREMQRSISQRPRKQQTESKCEHCGDAFVCRPQAMRKFCSQKCNQLHRMESNKRVANCVQCGEEFSAQGAFMRRDRRFCSRSCWSTHRMTGDRNLNWKGGISSARDAMKATEEYKQWRLDVFRRDHFTCVACLKGTTQGNPIEAHHLQKFSDHPELATDTDNGCTLCRKCHKATYNCEEIFEAFLRNRILRDFTSDARVAVDLAKIKSGLHGDMQRSAEMTDPAYLQVSA